MTFGVALESKSTTIKSFYLLNDRKFDGSRKKARLFMLNFLQCRK